MSYFFYNVIAHLRQHEEMMLYGNLLEIAPEELQKTAIFLEIEYARESLEYPYIVPSFDADAALWAAQTVYLGAQFILYREHKIDDITPLFADYTGKITASAILSADLCLRFLPALIRHLRVIDPTDSLIDILEKKCYTWHYSAVLLALEVEKLDFNAVIADKCLFQLYANRIVEYKKTNLAQLPVFMAAIKANLGIFTADYWKEMEIINN